MFSITKKEVLPTQELLVEELNKEELSQVIGGNSDDWGWHHHWHHHHHGHWEWEKRWEPVWTEVWESSCW